MSKAVIFVRVSTDAQDFDEQKRELVALAHVEGDGDSDLLFIEHKESAICLAEDEREGLNELKALITEDSDVNCVFLWEVSRLARRQTVLYSMLEFFESHNTQLIIKEPSLKRLNADGTPNASFQIVFSIMSTLSASEMKVKKERMMRGKREKVREGIYCGGYLPYGYYVDREDGNKLKVKEDEAEVIKLIYDLYENGLSIPQVARELPKWNISMKIEMIHHVLTNKHYTGALWKHKGNPNERCYPQIISPERFENCRKIAESRSTCTNKERRIYFAKGLIKCPTCGALWSSSGSKIAYHCSMAYKGKKIYSYGYHSTEQCQDKTSLSINTLDSILWHFAKHEEAALVFRNKEEDMSQMKGLIQRMERKLSLIEPRLQKCRQKRERLAQAYCDGMFTTEKYESEKVRIFQAEKQIEEEGKTINEELGEIQNRLRQYEESVAMSEKFDSYYSYLESLDCISDPIEMYNLVHKHIVKVTVVNEQFEHEFGVGKKMTRAKRITIMTRSREERQKKAVNLIYIPFDGKGGITLLREYGEGNERYYEQVLFRYLKRFVDDGKIRYRAKLAAKKQEQASEQ